MFIRSRQEVARQTVSVQQEIDSLARQFKTEEESLQRMKESLKDNENREIKLKEDKFALVERKEKLSSQASSTGKELENAKTEFANGEMEKRRLNEKEESLNEKLRDVLSKLQEARHDKRQSEKERRNKDCLETLQRLFSGVHGRLIDLCKPHQRKYDNAVSIILGKNIDAIVVDHQKTAIECIQYMREQQYGHFTFIPLDTISAKPINEKYRSIHHHARLAIDVIDYDPSFERALLYACGNALICDNLDTAKWICYEKDIRVKAVTLDGTIIHKSGLITGGTSASQSSSTRWEEKEIENMKRAKDKILSDLQEIAKQKRRVHNDDQLKSHIAGLERQLEYINGDMNTTIRKIQSIDDELAHIKASVESSSPELAKLTSSFEKTSTKLDGLKQKVYKIEDKLFKEFVKKIGVANIREYEEHQVKVVQELNEKRVEFVSHISRLENQLAFESAQLNELMTRLSTLRSILTNEQSNLEKYTNQKTAIESEITSVSTDLSDLQNQLAEFKLNYESKTEAVTSVKKNIKRVEKEVEEVRKAMLTHEDIIEKLKGEWYSILRKCKLEEIALPIKKGKLDDVLNMDATERPTQSTQDPNSMDIDELPPSSSITQSQSLATGSSAAFTQRSAMSSITIDYTDLDEDLKEQGTEEIENEFTEKVQKLNEEIERVAPNLKAIDRLEGVEIKAKQTDEEFERAKREAKTAKEKFLAVKDERFKRFMAAYDHIKEKTEQIYKELTKSNNVPLGGSAYLTLESDEEPYLHGVKYHVMPPMKRFRPMDQLSGGEKTVASLALLFAIHSFQPSPFFILDEIDAALDPENVSKVVRYIKNHAKPGFQFIVISLKNAFFQKAQALVGVCRNQDVNTSMVLTLDLEQYEE
ncbi:hypothetical protein BKA69DRAFT_607804 [Paraphysoderma sedebokerense]|nr:hypothetical protein BKA69DRAFT_607804 [Paraphysoderma sedebokerense]